jgi:LysR family transcriptional activator of nhaA
VKTEQIPTSAEWLNFHHLRYFWAVAREGSLRRAAESLNISQPSISSQIKLLEAALGEPLFRRSGRSLVLTEFGRVIQGYAEEIFTLGRELLATGRRGPAAHRVRLQIGVVDSFPKLLCVDVLRPVLAQNPPVQVSCREGKLADLLGQLAAHRLDAVLADEPPPSGSTVKTFTHELGESSITFCGSPTLARRLRGRFPQRLHGAPMLLPTPNTALRRDLEGWFRSIDVEPVVIGEFEDALMAEIIATDGHGVSVVPSLVAKEAAERSGLVTLGATDQCRIRLYLITVERRIEHPAVVVLAQEAGKRSLRGVLRKGIRRRKPQ